MSEPAKMRIVALAGPSEGQEWEFTQDEITFGRSTSNDVSLRDDTTVSRSHATLSWKDGKWEMRDDNSANGTHVLESGMRRKLESPLRFKGNRRFYFGSSEVECHVDPSDSDRDGEPEQAEPLAAIEPRYALQISISLAGGELVYRTTSIEAVVSEYRIPFNMDEVEDLKQRLRDSVARSFQLRLSQEHTETDEIQPELKQLGNWLRTHCIPRQINELLEQPRDIDITLTLDAELLGVPWELASTGDTVLGLQYATGRQVVFRDPSMIQQAPTRMVMASTRVLIVANPTGDVREAQRHGEEILNLARKRLPDTPVDFLAGERASKVDVLSRMQETDLVYYVGHTEHDQDEPANSAWVVADGYIHSHEFERLHPSPRFVIANSCESARESFVPGRAKDNNTGGIARAFLAAGTLNYVGTLWPIAAKESSYFGAALFEALTDRQPAGLAVLEARRKCLKHFGISDPVWASYVLYGDPTLPPF